MKRIIAVLAGLFIGFSALAQADLVGNKSSKLYFPDSCSVVKLIKKDNIVNFKTEAQAKAAGYTASSKCQSQDDLPAYFGNKSSKLFFPVGCSVVAEIKDENKVGFNTQADALSAGYKLSSKCPATK